MFSRTMILVTTLAAAGCSPSEETQDRESVAVQGNSSAHAGMVHDSSGGAIAHADSGGGDHSMHAEAEVGAEHASMGHVAPAGADHEGMSGMQHGAAAPGGAHGGQHVAAAAGHPAGHQAQVATHDASGAAHIGAGVAHDAPGAAHGEPDAAGAAGHEQHAVMPEHRARADSAAHGQHGAAQHAMPADTGHAAHGAMADSAHVTAGDSATHGEHDAMPGMDHGAEPGAAHAGADAGPGMQHEMAMFDLGGGWMVIGMAQAFAIGTIALPADDGTPLDERALYLTQPAIMFNVESPLSRVSLRTTLNFEGLTQPDGELTFGGWGEGFIDKRHPHTLVHEAMLSVNASGLRTVADSRCPPERASLRTAPTTQCRVRP